jgi:ubiquinone/menaquinone biosynthesis C-methylase UbiE
MFISSTRFLSIVLFLLASSVVSIASFSGQVAAQEALAEQKKTVGSDQDGVAASVRPGINKDFLDPELPVQQWVERFQIESREVFAGRKEILSALELSPGEAVADIGCGTGLFLEPLSKAVGEKGIVFAVDISPKFIKHLSERAKSESLSNVEVVLCSDRSTLLKPSSIDVALVCDTYHHFEYPQQTLKSIYQSMKEGGLLVVVDFDRVEGKSRPWTMEHVRAGKEVFRKEIEEAGFKFEKEIPVEIFKENYLLTFRKS